MDEFENYDKYKKKLEETKESKVWEKAQRVNTKESYKHYFTQYEYSDRNFNFRQKAIYKLVDIYKELLKENAKGFSTFQKNILWKLDLDSSTSREEAFLECDKNFDIIKKFYLIINSKEFEKFPKIKEDWIHTASITSYPEEEYEELKLQYDNSIKKLSDLIDKFKELSYTSDYKEKYIGELLLKINETVFGSINTDDIKETEFLASFSLKNCNEQNITLSKIEKNIREVFKSCIFCDNRMHNVGKLLYFIEHSIVELTQKHRSNPLLSLITPFYTIEIYIGENGIIFYNEKLDYYNRECLLYHEHDMSKKINEHKYLKSLDKNCKKKILELSKI